MMNRNDAAYVAWQNPDSRVWHVVGRLRSLEHGYLFNYTKGALASSKFTRFSGMDDVNAQYVSEDLFPLFKNRLLSSRRPEYSKFINWLGLANVTTNPIEILARSGGSRATDNIKMFQPIQIADDGRIEHYFFAHGISHLADSASKRISQLVEGERLLLCRDVQNKYDASAVLIRADHPADVVGYCPRFYSGLISKILCEEPSSLSLTVARISNDAPYHYRLLCKLSGVVSPSITEQYTLDDECALIESN